MIVTNNTINGLINHYKRKLEESEVKNSLYILEYLLAELLDCERFQLYVEKFSLSGSQIVILENWISRIKNKEPLQYVTNQAYFMDFKFFVDERSFIPRYETELLIEEVINIFKKTKYVKKGLDLGTGCGNIAISIVKYLPNIFMIATDISRESMEVAKTNIIKYNLIHKISLRFSDLFDNITDVSGKLDFIVSNPPYLTKSEIKTLPQEVKYEPEIALYGGDNGLFFYKNVINYGDTYLKPGGYIFLEIGTNQASKIHECIIKNSNLRLVKFILDYNNIKRILVIKKS